MSKHAYPEQRVLIASATRKTQDAFMRESALGLSLLRLNEDRRIKGVIAFENRFGLPAVYNTALAAAAPDDIVAFIHDDVWLDDHHFCDHLIQGLAHFDIVGVAGNRRRLPGQPSWLYTDIRQPRETETFVSGAVAHGAKACGEITWFGPLGVECELLDGVLLAARASRLLESGVVFDTRFDFHFYDLDFCRSAREKQLRLGTWPIAITHQSDGSFGDPRWQAGLSTYLDKWGD